MLTSFGDMQINEPSKKLLWLFRFLWSGQFHRSSAQLAELAGLHAALHQWALLDGPASWGENQLWLERRQPGLPCPPEAVWGDWVDWCAKHTCEMSISAVWFTKFICPSPTELHQQMSGVQGGHHHQTEWWWREADCCWASREECYWGKESSINCRPKQTWGEHIML